ncbi:hypothetical protein IKG60_01985 [Candidatus Saccharibacteria bacterium]|nr:hypothetical protein [Candidatus Saccharibacteria bacterium]
MKRKEFRKGAASFYVVAFSTLILMVIVVSFTALVVAQITRTSNDDLSQSAYDAALAGVEDAKLAFYNYQSCVAQGVTAKMPASSSINTCEEIVWAIENATDEDALAAAGLDPCDLVGEILGRNVTDNGVMVSEGRRENNMQEWYTCVKINTVLKDYRASLSSSNQIKAIQPKFKNISADKIKSIRLSWGANLRENQKKYSSASNYLSVGDYNPPTLALALVQAEKGFTINDFYMPRGEQTNSGMIYLVPQNNSGSTALGADVWSKSTDKVSINKAYKVNCPNKAPSDEFACAIDIGLPDPIDSSSEWTGRFDDNFIIAVMLPYGEPTDFALEFFCADGVECGKEMHIEDDGTISETEPTTQASLQGIQIAFDSTGRANDLFRRVETRLEGNDSFAMTLMGPLEVVGGSGGSGGSDGLKKDMVITCEYNFGSDGDGCMNMTSDE